MMIVVQDSNTREILWSAYWIDLAIDLYSETDPQKFVAAAKSLGTILSLRFYDTSTLHWSGLSTSTNEEIFRTLAIQTDKRVLLVNLMQGPFHCNTEVLYDHPVIAPTTISTTTNNNNKNNSLVLLGHLCEKTIGGVPSSNALGLTNHWVLVGCADGSMKCYDWKHSNVVKKIKGLGKGDCVMDLLAAVPYTSAAASTMTTTPNNSNNNNNKRILTASKRGSVYLIEIEIRKEEGSIDIQPPLARFQIPHSEIPETIPIANQFFSMEHAARIRYDGHSDRLYWYIPNSQSSTNTTTSSSAAPVLHVWNFQSLKNDFAKVRIQIQQNASTNSKTTLFKPDPTLIVHFPSVSTMSSLQTSGDEKESSNVGGTLGTTTTTISATNSSSSVALFPGILHSGFPSDAVVCASVTADGDFCLHGATVASWNTNTTVQATPCYAVSLSAAIMDQLSATATDGMDENFNHNNNNKYAFRIHAIMAAPLSPTAMHITVATNWGLVILDMPIYSNPTLQTRNVVNASRHLHLGAGLGSLGKSVMAVHNSNLVYGSLDVLQANPVGLLEPKNIISLYESPPAQHMPVEFYRRPFRMSPVLLPSPSNIYVAVFWPCEFRYEVLHIPTLLQLVEQIRAGSATVMARRNPVVAIGTGVCDFAWVTDEDVFAVLHSPDLMEQAVAQIPKKRSSDKGEEESGFLFNTANLNKIMIGASAIGQVTKTATKAATSAAMTTTLTMTSVTKGATKTANRTVGVTTKAIRSGAMGVTKGVKKSFGIFGGGKKKKGSSENEGSIMTADDEEDDEGSAMTPQSMTLQAPSAADMEALKMPTATQVRQRYVELRGLELVESHSNELAEGIPAANCTSLGELSLRGGNRNRPTLLLGGPVLCIASKSEEDKEGYSQFYTRKKDANGHYASSYQSSGPTLPYPDLLEWDDDGCLCAIVVENRVAVYLSNEPVFVLLGTVRIGSPTMPTAPVTSIKFIHGALFCCTWNSVHCVLLGDFNGGICLLDTYLLASTEVTVPPPLAVPEHAKNTPLDFFPNPIVLPLVQPTVLGYQSGSLMVSTLRGVLAIPLWSSLMRIGLLLASGQIERAAKWFDAVPNSHHEHLAIFLERRGHPSLALRLPGLSLQTIVDLSMKYGTVDRLEDVVETYGVQGLRSIDMGRGLSPSIFGPGSTVHSVMVCVGAYLLAHGRVELTRRLATECLRSGGNEDGRKDAFSLATLLLHVDENDATRLIQRAVVLPPDDSSDEWLMGRFARDYLFARSK
jgi:hypothetical protein